MKAYRPYIILALATIIAVTAVQHNAAVKSRNDNISGCERGNANRQSDYDAAEGDAQDALYFATQEHDPEIAGGWRRRFDRKTIEASRIVRNARETGQQTAPGQVTVSCEKLFPSPSWWPL